MLQGNSNSNRYNVIAIAKIICFKAIKNWSNSNSNRQVIVNIKGKVYLV